MSIESGMAVSTANESPSRSKGAYRPSIVRAQHLMLRYRLVVGVFLAVVLFSAPALGQRQLAQNWDDLSPRERREALRNYRQHDSLPPQRKNDMEDRYERWRRLPPEEQSRIRRNYDRMQQLDPAERERLQKRYDHWKKRTRPER